MIIHRGELKIDSETQAIAEGGNAEMVANDLIHYFLQYFQDYRDSEKAKKMSIVLKKVRSVK